MRPAHERQAIGEDIKAVQLRLTVGHAACAQTGGQSVGSSHTVTDPNCPCVAYGEERQHGVAARVHQKNASQVASRYCIDPSPN